MDFLKSVEVEGDVVVINLDDYVDDYEHHSGGVCPSCGFSSVMDDGEGGLVCSWIDCKNPTAIGESL